MAAPKDPKDWVKFGDAGSGMVEGRHYDKPTCYLRAVELDTKYCRAWYKLGYVGGGEVEGRTYNKRDCYVHALELDPKYFYAWHSLGNLGGGLVEGRTYDKRACYLRVLESNPKYSLAWHSLGKVGGGVVEGREYDKQGCFLRAVELDPKFALAWSSLGWTGGGTVDGSSYDKIACYDVAMRCDPDLARKFNNLEIRDFGKLMSYRRALELDPGLSDAWRNLGTVGGGVVRGRTYTAQECAALAEDPSGWQACGAPALGTAQCPTGSSTGSSQALLQRDEHPAESSSGSSEAMLRRVIDLDRCEDFLPDFAPIVGVMRAPLLPVEEAAVATGVEDMDAFGFMAAEAGARLATSCPHGLDKDEAGALYLYTMDSQLYRELNARLRVRDRTGLKCFFPLLRLLLQARNKLPACSFTVYRGVDLNLKGKFKINDEFYWWSFTSTTKRMDVTKNFLGDSEKTFFMIATSTGREIVRYSTYAGDEEEVLLFPGTKLRVVSVMDLTTNVHMVQLEEIVTKVELVR